MKRTIFLYIFFFAAGFFVHALFFPDTFSNGLTDVQNLIVPNPSTAPAQSSNPLTTVVNYDGSHFSRHNITVQVTRYVSINNQDKTNKPMWLIANIPELTTTRGYGYTESVTMQCNKKGQFVVAEKDNPQEKLVITVK